MATIAYTESYSQDARKLKITWENVTEADICQTFDFGNVLPADISIEADDTSAWGGATLTMVGSNGGGGVACTSMNESTASWTANALFSILQRPNDITPTLTGGTSQSVTIYMVVWYERS